MSQSTVNYKRTLKGSIGAGMQSVAGGDRRFYVLEHKVGSKYHKAGEQQTIIVDQIELGRDPKCQVRFDESFSTVSRRHAAIVRDGDNWKIVPLSKTNTTYLNGHPIDKEWYLQNGDEIQLSTNGPKIGFNVPAGEKGMVKSLRLTTRLNLFRQQALRPYKRAMVAIAVVFVAAIGAMGIWNYRLQDDLALQSKQLAEQIMQAKGSAAQIDSLRQELIKANNELADQQKKLKAVQRQARNLTVKVGQGKQSGGISKVFGDVYYVVAVPQDANGKEYPDYAWSGTGFLLDNGDFVTAQHMIHCASVGSENAILLNALYHGGALNIKLYCMSPNNQFDITYNYKNMPFRLGRPAATKDDVVTFDDGTSWPVRQYAYGGGDWAVLKTNNKGSMPFDTGYSTSMPVQTQLHILGFPAGQGVTTKGNVSPIYSTAVTARQGLEDDGTIKTANDNSDHGNSGGPVLVEKDGNYKVVGILVGANKGSDSMKGRVVPIANAQ